MFCIIYFSENIKQYFNCYKTRLRLIYCQTCYTGSKIMYKKTLYKVFFFSKIKKCGEVFTLWKRG